MFKDTVDRLLADIFTAEAIDGTGDGCWPAHLWSRVEENGLTLAAVPEELNGVGADWSDCFDIATSTGAHAAPMPLAETMATHWLLGRAGASAPPGPIALGTSLDCALSSDGFSGTVPDVPWGRFVTHVLVSVGGRLALLPTETAGKTLATNVADEPRDTLTFVGVEPLLLTNPHRGFDDVMLAGATVRAAQIAGALREILRLAVEYAAQREQFGRPIGKFQAVQQQLAVLAEQSMMARIAAEAAFFEKDEARLPFAVAVAKQVSSEAAGQGAAIAHSVLGAIGFTHEFRLHPLTRRLWSWRSEFGSARFWADRIGDAAYEAGEDAYWNKLIRSDLTISLNR